MRIRTATFAGVLLALGGIRAATADPTFTVFDVTGDHNAVPAGIDANAVIAGAAIGGSTPHARAFLRTASGQVTAFDASGHMTQAVGVDAGEIVGWFKGSGVTKHGFHGFIRKPDGTFVAFDVPGANTTMPTAIRQGAVVGWYYAGGGVNPRRGFVRAADGSFTALDVSRATTPQSINAADDISGVYEGPGGAGAFLRHHDGTLETFNAPVAGGISTHINDSGEITGTYTTSDAQGTRTHGYVRATGGSITVFDVADSTETRPSAINGAGVVVGSFTNIFGVDQGFMRATDGTITIVNVPVAIDTYPASINDAGVITGSYLTARGRNPRRARVGHGFVRQP